MDQNFPNPQELLDAAVDSNNFHGACVVLDMYSKRRKAGEPRPSGGDACASDQRCRIYDADEAQYR